MPEQQSDAAAPQPESLAALDPSTVTPEQFSQLKDLAAKADENWERLLRTTADFDNFRKRATREKQEAIKFANENLVTKLLPVLDSFEMAMAAAQNTPAPGAQTLQSLQDGVNMVHQQLKTVLAESGLETIEAAGQPFDPNLHEAVSQVDNPDLPEGTVAQQLRKGYRLRERLLRPATVIVSKKPQA